MTKIRQGSSLILAVCLLLSIFSISAMAASTDYPVKINALTIEERNELFYQEGAVVTTGLAYIAKNQDGTNGAICSPFTAEKENLAFAVTSAPGATDYNVQLYVGDPGAGEIASNYATVQVNNGVSFTGLDIGANYYLKVSSNTLTTSSCTAFYEMVTY